MADEKKANEIEITDEMIEAGHMELKERSYGEDLREVVEEIYRVMEVARSFQDS